MKYEDVGHDRQAQTIETTSFSALSRPLDEVIEIWSISMFMLGSERAIPTLNPEACNLLTLP